MKRYENQSSLDKKEDNYWKEMGEAGYQEEIRDILDKALNNNIKSDILSSKEKKSLTTVDAVLAAYRAILFLIFHKCVKQNYVTTIEFQLFNEIYNNYVELGGNGLIKALYEKFKQIPFESELFEQNKQSKKNTRKKKRKQ